MLNIAGITSVLPLTGVPLPFMSYGNNALAALLLAVGVLMSISRYGVAPEPEHAPKPTRQKKKRWRR
jgi:cell division protein FtsW (lipid II flippase)